MWNVMILIGDIQRFLPVMFLEDEWLPWTDETLKCCQAIVYICLFQPGLLWARR